MMFRKLFPACGALLGILASGCSSDEFEPETPVELQRPTASAEITIKIPVGYSLDDESRAAPPGSGPGAGYNPLADGDALKDIAKVDRIRIITFRSENGSESFIHDSSRDAILNVSYPDSTIVTDDNHTHLVAHHTLHKEENCRYRIVALAYSSTTVSSFPSDAFTLPAPGDQSRFKLTCDGDELAPIRYEAFKLDIVKNNCAKWNDFWKMLPSDLALTHYSGISYDTVETPQLFFGVCTTSSGSEIIDYFETDKYGSKRTDLPITGILRRGMAKVDIEFTPKDYKPTLTAYSPKWIALLADNPRLETKLTSYDDFLPQVTDGGTDADYHPIAYMPLSAEDVNSGDKKHFTVWLLPGKTRLAIRERHDKGGIHYLLNGQITAANVEISGGNATGVISPDLIDGEFYFRRNHKYLIKISDPLKILKNSSLK